MNQSPLLFILLVIALAALPTLGRSCSPRYRGYPLDLFSDAAPEQDCPRKCPKEISPICATDNITYMNECLMKQAVCETRMSITKRSDGYCPKGEREKDCPEDCSGVAPNVVCDRAANNYENICELKKIRCGVPLSEVHHQFSDHCNYHGQWEEEEE